MNEKTANNLRKLGQTSTPLGISASYTSDGYDVSGEFYVRGIGKADQDGTVYVQFSGDGSNWYGEESYSYTANDLFAFKVPICAPFVRFKWTNGGVAQTDFNLIFYATM